MTLNHFVTLLLPEITLTAVAFLIFILDMIIGGDEVRGRRLRWLAFLGVLLTLVATILVWPLADAGGLALAFDVDLGFGGDALPMMVLDPLALFFKLFTLIL